MVRPGPNGGRKETIRSMNSAQCIQRAGEVPGLSHVLRWWAHRFSEDSVVTIRHGLAAGFRWRRHHRYVNGYWVGHYELPIQQALSTLLGPGHTFYDVGANAGFFTLVASRLVGPRGRCYAFDPLPDNRDSIVEQITLNNLTNCHAVPVAIGETERQAAFSFDASETSTAHLGLPDADQQQVEAQVTTLDAAWAKFGAPDVVKMDIEGAEATALRGARRMLQEVRPCWLIELHGPPCEAEVRQTLAAAQYSFYRLDGSPLAMDVPWPHHVVARYPLDDGRGPLPSKAGHACR